MQLKKLLQGGTFALVVAACAIAVPSVAHADGETPAAKAGSFEKALVDNVMIDGNDGSLYASTDAQELLVGIAKVNKAGKATVASWASYEMSNAVVYDEEDEDAPALLKVDLSKLSSTKDNYIALKGNGAESIAIIKIQASTQKNIKAKFDASSGLQAGEGTPAAISNDKYIYRTQYGRWSNLWDSEAADGKGAVVSLAMYQEEGAKLFVRAAGTEIGADGYDADHTLAQGSTTVKYDGITDVVLYESKTAPLPSNEAKVTIPAKAKGPKVAINYLKGTVKIPNGSEWRLVTGEEIKYDTGDKPFADAGEKTITEVLGKLTPAAASANTSKAQVLAATKTPTPTPTTTPEPEEPAELKSATLEVRKAANGKKAASKWTPIELTEAKGFGDKIDAGTTINLGYAADEDDGTLTTTPNTEAPVATNYKKDLEVKYGDAGVKGATLLEGEGTSSVLAIEYVAGDKKATKYNLKITNNGKAAYEFVVKAKDSTAASITDSDKPVTAKAGKAIVLKDVKDEQVVFVRTAGDKKTKSWVGAFESLGIIDIPKVVIGAKPEPTPSPTPGA